VPVRSRIRPRAWFSTALVSTALVTASVVLVGGVGSAQTRGRRPPPRPATPEPAAPLTAMVDAGTSSLPFVDAGGPWPRPQIYDGGARLSPLTPTEAEMPPGSPAVIPPDYDRLISEIAVLRARIATVSDNLFRSRLAVSVQTDGDKQRIEHLSVALDDGVVWEAPTGFVAEDPTPTYDHAVAPGRHTLTVTVDRKDARDATFSTQQSSRVALDVPKDQRLDVVVRLEEDSSMGGKFPADHKGEYDLRIRVKAQIK
jgi:hypothetical protein